MGLTQQELKTQIQLNNAKVEQCSKDQKFIAQQVQANGHAVAQLTLRQFDEEDRFDSTGSGSLLEDEDDPDFQNVFGKNKSPSKPEHSRAHKHRGDNTKQDSVPHHTLPKMYFPKFDGSHPKIWIDNCANYFSIYSVPASVWLSSATMHLEGNAAKWWQTYKQQHNKITWLSFCLAFEQEFGADDYRTTLTELIALKQTGTVEDYTTQFQALQFDITMHSCYYDDLFSHHIMSVD